MYQRALNPRRIHVALVRGALVRGGHGTRWALLQVTRLGFGGLNLGDILILHYV